MTTTEIFDEALRLSNLNEWIASNEVLDAIAKNDAITIDIQRLYAKNFRHIGDFANALRCLDQLLILKDDDGAALLEQGMCLEGFGLKDEALTSLNELVLIQPKNPWALLAWLRLRVEKESPESIIEELYRIKARALPQSDLNTVIDHVRARLTAFHDLDSLAKLDHDNILELNLSQEEKKRSNLCEIYNQFESLGHDCEFGFAQRKVGAEPIGLFRWCGIQPHHLMSVMANRLEDFDYPEHYALEKQTSGQYFLKDFKYNTVTHTHILAGVVPEDILLKRMLQRQTFLKRKLLSEIHIGNKIFVYRFYNDPHDDYIRKVVMSLQNIGMKKILIARKADDDNLPGSSKVFADSVMIGYLSKEYPDTPFDEWNEIIQDAYSYFEKYEEN